jgi:hypothetical protein
VALGGAAGCGQLHELNGQVTVRDRREVIGQKPEHVGKSLGERPPCARGGGDAQRGRPEVSESAGYKDLLEPAGDTAQRQDTGLVEGLDRLAEVRHGQSVSPYEFE